MRIIGARHRYLSPSLNTFQTFDTPIVLERGEGVRVWDTDNRSYIDMLGQNLCVSIGYKHPRILSAAKDQLDSLAHCTTVYYHEASCALAKEIVSTLPDHPSGDEWVVHFVNDGSEAVDLAVQMARVYTCNHEFYALHKGYHGLHGCAAGLTAIGKTSQHAYARTYGGIKHISANDIGQLQNDVQFSTCGKVAGIIIEPLQGYGGIHPLDTDFMKHAFDTVHKHGGVVILDEVQTGYGRCGDTFWGCQMNNNNVVPDILTCAKGMGNGVGILGAVVCRRSIAEAFTDKMFFNTYGGNPFSCAVGVEVLRVMKDENIQQNCKTQGERMHKRAQKLCDTYPNVYTEIRGKGLFQGLEIYGKSKEDSQHHAVKLHKRVLERGVIVGRGSAEGNVFRLQPPMSIQKEDIETVMDVLEDVAIEATQHQ